MIDRKASLRVSPIRFRASSYLGSPPEKLLSKSFIKFVAERSVCVLFLSLQETHVESLFMMSGVSLRVNEWGYSIPCFDSLNSF